MIPATQKGTFKIRRRAANHDQHALHQLAEGRDLRDSAQFVDARLRLTQRAHDRGLRHVIDIGPAETAGGPGATGGVPDDGQRGRHARHRGEAG